MSHSGGRVDKTAALVKAVEALPGLAALEKLWARQAGETELEYLRFLDWLDLGKTRGSPPKESLELAARWDWARRALAYERAEKLAKEHNASEAPIGARVVSNLALLVRQETDKLLQQSATTEGSVASLRDITAIIELVAKMQKADLSHRAAQIDLSRLTKDELQIVLKAQEILRRASEK